MKCYYHGTDLDGHCSGAIVKLTMPDCEMIPVNYNHELDIDSIEPGETVYIVDFSFPPEIMEQIHNKARMIWIDHHESPIRKIGEVQASSYRGLREIGKAGCELTWEFLYPDTPLPLTVKLLGRYDVWDHANVNVVPFQYGMRNLSDTRPDQFDMWENLIWKNDMLTVEALIRDGEVIVKYLKNSNAVYMKSMAFEAEFEGLRAIVANKPMDNSLCLTSVFDPEKHDIMILFGCKGREYKYTLYSADDSPINVSILAERYGGGGHKHAAGFYTAYNIFEEQFPLTLEK